MKSYLKFEWIMLTALGVGCGTVDAPATRSDYEVVDVQVEQTTTRLQITGFDAAGNAIALADVKSGPYISSFDELAGTQVDGRQVSINYKYQQYSFDSVNVVDGVVAEIHVMPLPEYPGLDQFIRDPRVEPVLVANRILPAPAAVVEAYAKKYAAPVAGGGEVPYDTYYQENSYGSYYCASYDYYQNCTDWEPYLPGNGYIEDLANNGGTAASCGSTCSGLGNTYQTCSGGQTLFSAAIMVDDYDARWCGTCTTETCLSYDYYGDCTDWGCACSAAGAIIEQSCGGSVSGATCNGSSNKQCQASRKECPATDAADGGQAVDWWCTNAGQKCWPCGIALDGSSEMAHHTSTWVESSAGWIITQWTNP